MIYDKGVTLLDTWRALEGLVDEGKCKAIGLSDVGLVQTYLFSGSGRRKSGVFERMESLTGFDASPTRRRLLCTNCKIPGIFSHSPWAK